MKEDTLIIREDLPDNLHTKVAGLYARARETGDIHFLEPYLSEQVITVFWNEYTLEGIPALEAYIHRWSTSGKVRKTLVDVCNYYSRAAVMDTLEDRSHTVTLFAVRQDKVQAILIAPDRLAQYPLGCCDFYLFPYAFREDIIREEDVPSVPHALPCPCCGKPSHALKWTLVDTQTLSAQVSRCLDCDRLVELRPERFQPWLETPKPFRTTKTFGTWKRNYPPYLQPARYENSTSRALESWLEPMKVHPAIALCPALSNPVSLSRHDLCDLRRLSPEAFDELKACYVAAHFDGNTEASVKLAEWAYMFDHDLPQALEYLHEAAGAGNKDAVNNLFTLQWKAGKYADAVRYLHQVADEGLYEPVPEISWNLGVLYYLGESLEGNPLQTDLARSLYYLDMNDSRLGLDPEERWRIVGMNPTALVNRTMRQTNPWALSGCHFHRFLETLGEFSKKGPYNKQLQQYLFSLRFKEDVMFHLAEQKGIGDESWFYIGEKGRCSASIQTLCKHIRTDESLAATWHVYLLTTAPHVLPMFWHGCYNRRKYIFTLEDLDCLPCLDQGDLTNLVSTYGLLPQVSIFCGKGTVSCCYWNDWEGLVRETVTVSFVGSRVLGAYVEKKETLFRYDCGIMY